MGSKQHQTGALSAAERIDTARCGDVAKQPNAVDCAIPSAGVIDLTRSPDSHTNRLPSGSASDVNRDQSTNPSLQALSIDGTHASKELPTAQSPQSQSHQAEEVFQLRTPISQSPPPIGSNSQPSRVISIQARPGHSSTPPAPRPTQAYSPQQILPQQQTLHQQQHFLPLQPSSQLVASGSGISTPQSAPRSFLPHYPPAQGVAQSSASPIQPPSMVPSQSAPTLSSSAPHHLPRTQKNPYPPSVQPRRPQEFNLNLPNPSLGQPAHPQQIPAPAHQHQPVIQQMQQTHRVVQSALQHQEQYQRPPQHIHQQAQPQPGSTLAPVPDLFSPITSAFQGALSVTYDHMKAIANTQQKELLSKFVQHEKQLREEHARQQTELKGKFQADIEQYKLADGGNKAEIKDLKDKLSFVSHQLVQVQNAAARQRDQYGTVELQLRSATEHIEALKRQRDDLADRCNSLEALCNSRDGQLNANWATTVEMQSRHAEEIRQLKDQIAELQRDSMEQEETDLKPQQGTADSTCIVPKHEAEDQAIPRIETLLTSSGTSVDEQEYKQKVWELNNASNESIKGHKAEIRTLRETIDGLKAENQALSDSRDEEIRKLKEEVRKEAEERMNAEMNETWDRMMGSPDGGASQSEEHLEQQRKMEEDLKTVRAQLEEVQEQKKWVQHALDGATDKARSTEQKSQELSADLEVTRTDLQWVEGAMKKAREESEETRKKLQIVEAARETLERDGKVTELSLTTERNELLSDVQQLRQQVRSLRGMFDEQLTSSEKKLEEARKELETAHDACETLQREGRAKELSIATERNELLSDVEQLRQQARSLRAEFDEGVTTSEKQLEEARNTAKAAVKKVEEISAARDQERRQLEEELRKARQEATTATTKVQNLEREVKRFQAMLECSEKRARAAEAKVKEDLGSWNEERRALLEKHEGGKMDAQLRLAASQDEVVAANKKLVAALMDGQSTRHELEIIRAQALLAVEEHDKLIEEVSQLRIQNSELETELGHIKIVIRGLSQGTPIQESPTETPTQELPTQKPSIPWPQPSTSGPPSSLPSSQSSATIPVPNDVLPSSISLSRVPKAIQVIPPTEELSKQMTPTSQPASPLPLKSCLKPSTSNANLDPPPVASSSKFPFSASSSRVSQATLSTERPSKQAATFQDVAVPMKHFLKPSTSKASCANPEPPPLASSSKLPSSASSSRVPQVTPSREEPFKQTTTIPQPPAPLKSCLKPSTSEASCANPEPPPLASSSKLPQPNLAQRNSDTQKAVNDSSPPRPPVGPRKPSQKSGDKVQSAINAITIPRKPNTQQKVTDEPHTNTRAKFADVGQATQVKTGKKVAIDVANGKTEHHAAASASPTTPSAPPPQGASNGTQLSTTGRKPLPNFKKRSTPADSTNAQTSSKKPKTDGAVMRKGTASDLDSPSRRRKAPESQSHRRDEPLPKKRKI